MLQLLRVLSCWCVQMWQENQKNTMKGFRQAMGRLQDNLDSTAQARTAGFDDVSDGRMIELEKLTKLIRTEAGNRQQSEASMMQLLEGMHQKMHTEVFCPPCVLLQTATVSS